jgi:low temperature requirement protein LtrA
MTVAQGSPRAHWYSVPARALFFSFLLTLMSFAVTLFFTILGSVVAAALRHSSPDLPFAYRHVALPVALGVGSVVLVISLTAEIRHLRQTRALAGIARASR